jgi:hypothetical protein
MRASRNVPRPPAIPRDVAGPRAHAPEPSHSYAGAGASERRTEDSSVQKRNQIRGAEPHEVEALIDEGATTRVGPRPEPPELPELPKPKPKPTTTAEPIELRSEPLAPPEADVLVRSSELEWCEGEQTQQWSGLESGALNSVGSVAFQAESPADSQVEPGFAVAAHASPEFALNELSDLNEGAGAPQEEDAQRTQASVDLVSSARQRLTGASQLAAHSKRPRGSGSRAILLGLGVHLLITVTCVYFAWVSPLKQFIGEQQRRHTLESQQRAQALAELEAQRAREHQAFELELTQLRSQLATARADAAAAAAVETATGTHTSKSRRTATKSFSSRARR